MPFYDLYCADCDKEFNIMASIADKTARTIPCPDCGSIELENVYLSGPAVIKNRAPEPTCKSASSGCGGCRFAG